MTRALWGLGVSQAARAMRERRITCLDYTRGCLDRSAALEPQVQAWAWLDAERALEHARRADRLLSEPASPPLETDLPLLGMPLGIKDIFDTAGIPTERGSPIFAGYRPARSAEAVHRLEAAGAWVLGKTVTAELAFFAPGKTRNPWNPSHTPGGSSSGSAAAVAAGFVPGALGTQTNGSVIRPAAYCGIVGYKPGQGAIPDTGVFRFSRTLDQIGVFARSVGDAALLAAAAMARPLMPTAVRAPRLAAVRSPVWEHAQAPQRQAFASTLGTLAQAGATLAEVELQGACLRAHAAHRTIMAAEAAHALHPLWLTRRGEMSAVLCGLIEEGLRIGATDYLDALELRARVQAELSALLERFDAILTPPATGEAPATLAHTGDPVFCTLWTLAGLPALTVPVALGPHGLPLGLQIVGGDDAALLGVACWCEQHLPFPALFHPQEEDA